MSRRFIFFTIHPGDGELRGSIVFEKQKSIHEILSANFYVLYIIVKITNYANHNYVVERRKSYACLFNYMHLKIVIDKHRQ